MGDKDKKSDGSELERGVGLGLLKDLTLAIMELRQVVGAQIKADVDKVESTDALREAIESLDHHVVGVDFMLSRYSFAFDKMVEIRKGKPGEEGRTPDWDDFAAAVEEFDKETELEQKKAEKEETEQEDDQEGEKPPMISNTPPSMTKKLPPRPVMPSTPK